MPEQDARDKAFTRWVRDFRFRAMAEGISVETLDAVGPTFRFLPEVVARDRTQPEFTTPIWEYLDRAVTGKRIAEGRAVLMRHTDLFDRIEAEFCVPRAVVAAIWGLESAFGTCRGDIATLNALASLAFDGRRGALFEAQLVAALRIVEAGDIPASRMVGSWAGAMGHTQFMPTSYLDRAVDFDGDGRRDIWSDDPADALGSAANYLRQSGWRPGEGWGREVFLPENFDAGLGAPEDRREVSAWARLGVKEISGAPLRGEGGGSVLLPAGHQGPAFLLLNNFRVIRTYNAADAYAIAVGHLADRLGGGPALTTAWPRHERPLSLNDRRELQQRLSAAGFDTGGVDGLTGPNTRSAIRNYQRREGLPADGFASAALLDRLRGGATALPRPR
ncbi:membrane-bound lytic murein transglycosylase B [Aliiruegeria haliotis]|uniref:Membrane-bound lytic murein transglycosylase B n=1 Tax=Aliiruegeria haliotis TaxID=1280846 RepID=A0A2T0RSS8_9RHOB|nr:lytic murein transglycosylase [Aliiruegeria haliotis]PRY24177.1 membrane-bound lytic murein transglycosylase B [Aliiruegeria haliotis]